ncbi:fluoride efflux transporter FluC [Limosilactobacillus caecicola]|uniref:fluoride efflux transporter FluC n=1 Tax=Limosilactobacillus caecicola TaxID=2941332 RepID=UPI00203DF74F|nr:CrcB family protein [Limosilactobacillus caecicola]
MKLRNLIGVAIFGFCGGICRYLLSKWFNNSGIILANLLGCFLLAFLTYYVIERGLFAEWITVGIGTGFIGAFTTFSTFASTTAKLATQQFSSAITYFVISAGGGLLMASLGFWLARQIGRRNRH